MCCMHMCHNILLKHRMHLMASLEHKVLPLTCFRPPSNGIPTCVGLGALRHKAAACAQWVLTRHRCPPGTLHPLAKQPNRKQHFGSPSLPGNVVNSKVRPAKQHHGYCACRVKFIATTHAADVQPTSVRSLQAALWNEQCTGKMNSKQRASKHGPWPKTIGMLLLHCQL